MRAQTGQRPVVHTRAVHESTRTMRDACQPSLCSLDVCVDVEQNITLAIQLRRDCTIQIPKALHGFVQQVQTLVLLG